MTPEVPTATAPGGRALAPAPRPRPPRRRRIWRRRWLLAWLNRHRWPAYLALGALALAAALVAAGLGLALDEVDEELVPLVAQEDQPGDARSPGVERGQVAGVQQTARVFAAEREVVRLELTLAVGAEDPRDEVELDADPPLRLVVPGGIPGEPATVAAVLNAVVPATELRGLVTVLDLPAGR
jgi:4-hydroxy-tetrahydrodipicolinate reductase